MNTVPLPRMLSDRGLRQLLDKQCRGRGKAAAFARAMGVNESTISRYRTGKTPHLDNLARFLDYKRSALGMWIRIEDDRRAA